ncbi:hypothetical protein [Clostridium omnivorum]|uniref:Uncharacterized protein n=1 Tax=Clostridium omnivorum TaxID=1604902 RepID=A0ABQ5NBJ8_9CLOT|nr:hypothetical protein [Clostridium sp. E14]GLC32637.1 hypothetical protein bsdE14_40470 [Clostridium sp. E14]
MLHKVKQWPQMMTFTIGLGLVLIGSAFTSDYLIRLIGGILISLGFLFIFIASDRIHIKSEK